jgi:hypothetical protein
MAEIAPPFEQLHVPRRELERRKFRNFLRPDFALLYIVSAVALERAGVDLDICTIRMNSSALEVACPPPGIRAKI